jgi:hypothetical protein
MKQPTKKESSKRGFDLAEKFRQQMVEKNERGIKKYGGNLKDKNAFKEAKAEILDLANYFMEAEEQINKLVRAADNIVHDPRTEDDFDKLHAAPTSRERNNHARRLD